MWKIAPTESFIESRILNVFRFPDSELNLLNGFGFYFRWCDSEKQLYVFLVYKANMTFQMV